MPRQAARAAWGVEGDARALAQYRRQQLLRYHAWGNQHVFDDAMPDEWNVQQAQRLAAANQQRVEMMAAWDSPSDDGANARWFEPLHWRPSPGAQGAAGLGGDGAQREDDRVDALVDALDRRVCRAVSQIDQFLFSSPHEDGKGAKAVSRA